MAKRLVLILALLCLCALSAFSLSSGGIRKNTLMPDLPAFSMSAGGRVFYNGMFDISGTSVTVNGTSINNNVHNSSGFGIGGFFDVTYVEIGMDFIFGHFEQNDLDATQFGFTILGKFPFAAGPVTFFPLAGFDYQIFLSGETADGNTIKRDDLPDNYTDLYDAFSLVLGAGLDYSINAKFYLRGEVLLNFKMGNDSDKALKNKPWLTFGPRISVGAGYRF
jgi:hypothetical protein